MRQTIQSTVILFTSVLGLFANMFSTNAMAYDPTIMFNSLKTIVLIRGFSTDGGLQYGSGVTVAQNKVLTNCHIFRQTKEPWISHGEDIYRIEGVQADRWHDLCLLTTETLPFSVAMLGKASDLQKGEDIFAVGHSIGSPKPLTSIGNLKSIYKFEDSSIIRSNTRFALGASGSGLFDESGKLIGINTFKTVGKLAYYYALPVEWLAELEKLPNDKFPIQGKAFWEEDEDKKAFFLQAAVPDINEDWPKLAEVSERWTKAEPESAEAWYELGLAQDRLGEQDDAEKSYLQAIKLNPNHTDALFSVGLIASKKGDKSKVHAVNLTLLNLDKNAAAQFEEVTGCKDEC